MNHEWTALYKFGDGFGQFYYGTAPWQSSPKELWDFVDRAKGTVVSVFFRKNGLMSVGKPTIRRGFVNFPWGEKPDGWYWTVQLGPLARQFETWEEAMSFATEASNLQRL